MNSSTAALFSFALFIENFHVAFLLSVNICVYFQMKIMLKLLSASFVHKSKFIHEQPISKRGVPKYTVYTQMFRIFTSRTILT